MLAGSSIWSADCQSIAGSHFFCRQQNILPSREKRNWWWRKKASLWSKPSAFCLQFILVSLGFLSIYKCLHLDIIFYNYVMCYVPCHYLDTDEPWQWLSIFASLRLFLSTDLHQVQPKKYRKADLTVLYVSKVLCSKSRLLEKRMNVLKG